MIKKLKGPVMIFGAGGFIGINLLDKILPVRSDVVGVSSDPQKSWRIKKAGKNLQKHIEKGNLLDFQSINRLIYRYRPQTIFNLAAYGAYSNQQAPTKIYLTNFNSTVRLIESLKRIGFSVYVQAGSQSEYGLNCENSKESDELSPNSHYAVSKTAVYYLLRYYGLVEKLPVVHLRLYSVYGPWEEPGRLMPTLIDNLIKRRLPKFVEPQISRDFVYIDDAVKAIITVAARLKEENYGDVFNVASGTKTTMKDLALSAQKLFKIKEPPVFGSMKNRQWDLKNWWGNPEKIRKIFGWRSKTSLVDGLIKFYNHEKNNSQ